MSQKTSPPENPLETWIQESAASAPSKRLVVRPEFLDDEKLPESERVAVLREVFHRNIRAKQIKRLARYVA